MLYGEYTGSKGLTYQYDDTGKCIGFIYNDGASSQRYYYLYDLQGDVTAIFDHSGSCVAKYTYDVWGTIVAITDGSGNDVLGNAAHVGNVNPIRYKGYYYNVETGLYYVSSRYYDSEIGRFVNADSQLNDCEGPLGYNMFAYCMNNPVMYSDPTGHLPFFAITAAVGAAIRAIVGGVKAARAGTSVLTGALKGAAIGGTIGLGFGAAAGAALVGNVAATTKAVVAGAKLLGSYVASGGVGAGASYIANNISRYGQPAATAQQVTQRGKIGEAISGITKNTTRIYDHLVSGAKYRIPDGLTETVLSEVKNHTGTLSYTAQLKDFVSYAWVAVENLMDDANDAFLTWYTLECGYCAPDMNEIRETCPLSFNEDESYEEIRRKVSQFFFEKYTESCIM